MSSERGPNLRRIYRRADETFIEGMDVNSVRNRLGDLAILFGIAQALSEHFVKNNDQDAGLAAGGAILLFTTITTDAYFKGREIINKRMTRRGRA